jgi:hypothetical protein
VSIAVAAAIRCRTISYIAIGLCVINTLRAHMTGFVSHISVVRCGHVRPNADRVLIVVLRSIIFYSIRSAFEGSRGFISS